jgi:hypothetical protein
MKINERLPILSALYRKIEHINLEDINLCKKHLQKISAKCKNATAIIVIGPTGVGKTSFIHGASDHPLVYSAKTQDYRSLDPQFSELFKIGDTMTS